MDTGFRDAAGNPLQATAQRHYQVGTDERRLIEPALWDVATPPRDSRPPLRITFDRTLDHGLLLRCVRVISPGGHGVAGTIATGPAERWWQFTPRKSWTEHRYRVVVDPALEDIAGNSTSRVFDRDLTEPDDQGGTGEPASLWFYPTQVHPS